MKKKTKENECHISASKRIMSFLNHDVMQRQPNKIPSCREKWTIPMFTCSFPVRRRHTHFIGITLLIFCLKYTWNEIKNFRKLLNCFHPIFTIVMLCLALSCGQEQRETGSDLCITQNFFTKAATPNSFGDWELRFLSYFIGANKISVGWFDVLWHSKLFEISQNIFNITAVRTHREPNARFSLDYRQLTAIDQNVFLSFVSFRR